MDLNSTLFSTLNIEVKEQTKDQVVLTMPVNETVHQPMGFLHGGASVALAESAASLGAFLNIDPEKYNVFGIEINANHVKSKRDGIVYATANPVHIGKMTMVWEINITDENEQLISTSRCTIGVVERTK
ncbi:hotdog fold thioesterase [Alkalibacillus haloalkaliphilus]|uniref:hotdog fold thioesterase n=1 Tax=Alkalibacillus haloalkaliphilus TaxID=94136 RepID=UPI002935B819|nr:hotdog fold thioesterase [Alkalibacillus haloalkaliphilus]MDV2582131.1 hotdog fold thioesterase [Alkalibacillus haloalkaliphilus]